MTWLPLLWLTACTSMDPASVAHFEYIGQLQPLLQENSLLSERVLFQAAAIFNGGAKPEQIADGWTREIVPLAEHLHYQASFVVAPDLFTKQQAELVGIWGDRALAYRNLSEAIRSSDAQLWNEARDLTDKVKLREETWFDGMNVALGPYGYVLDPYP